MGRLGACSPAWEIRTASLIADTSTWSCPTTLAAKDSSIYTKPSVSTPDQSKEQEKKRTHIVPLHLQQILHRNPCSLRHHPRNIVRRHPIMEHRQRRLLIPIHLVPSAGSWCCSSGMVENRRREAGSNCPCRCATFNRCLASSSLRLTSLILSSRALSTQNPSQSRIFVPISGPLTSLPHPSQSSSLFPLLLQLLLDFVPPLHAKGVTFVLQAL